MTSTDSTNASSPDASDGLLLALNNCEDRLQLVLGDVSGNKATLLCSRELAVPGRTAQFLVPAVAEMLAEQESNAAQITRIACTRGPGSFTGIRLTLSAAAGIQAGCGAMLGGLDYLPLVATEPLTLGEAHVYVLTYARRGQVYLQAFAPDGSASTPVVPLPATEAMQKIKTASHPAMLVGTGVHKNIEIFQPLATQDVALLGPQWSHPKPDILLQAAMDTTYSMEVLEPAYGRNADAEDNLDDIARKRGIDPAEARRILKECRRS